MMGCHCHVCGMSIKPLGHCVGLSSLDAMGMWAGQELVAAKLPKLAAHLKRLNCDMTLLATDWFLCLFSTVLPSEVGVQQSTKRAAASSDGTRLTSCALNHPGA